MCTLIHNLIYSIMCSNLLKLKLCKFYIIKYTVHGIPICLNIFVSKFLKCYERKLYLSTKSFYLHTILYK